MAAKLSYIPKWRGWALLFTVYILSFFVNSFVLHHMQHPVPQDAAQITSSLFGMGGACLWFLSTTVETPSKFKIEVHAPKMGKRIGGPSGHGRSDDLEELADALVLQSRVNAYAAVFTAVAVFWSVSTTIENFLFHVAADQSSAVRYQVVSHNGETGEWVFEKTGGGSSARVKVLAKCVSYQWGKHEANKGLSSCSLNVGDTLTPNIHPEYAAAYLNIDELNGWLSITSDSEADRTRQSFEIESETVVPEGK